MLRPLLLIPAFALLGGCATSASPTPAEEQSVAGLERVSSKNVDTLFVAPGMELARFHRVMLDSVVVEFKKDWQKNHPEISADDMTRIRSQAGGAFRETFQTALSSNGGYGLATQGGADVLRVTTTISELEITKSLPAASSVPSPYVVSSADLVLLMELRDSESGALLVRAIDRETARKSGDLHVTDSVSNSTEARRALESWAAQLRKVLDEARAAH